MFSDFCSLFVIAFTIGLCYVTHYLALKCGKLLKIWKINPNIEIKDTRLGDMAKDFEYLLARMEEF